MKQLIKMSDYVLEQIEKLKNSEINILQFRNNIEAYANFLKQPLTIGMFVPCDDDGNVLEEPKCIYIYKTQPFECSSDEMYRCRKYLEAKEKVLFKGFEVKEEVFVHGKIHYFIQKEDNKVMYNFNNEWVVYGKLKTIEDLIPYNLELTDNQF